MPNQVTVTAKTGPDRQNTALVLTDVSRVDFDLNDKLLQVYQGGGSNVKEYELTTATTVTVTNTAGNFAFVVA